MEMSNLPSSSHAVLLCLLIFAIAPYLDKRIISRLRAYYSYCVGKSVRTFSSTTAAFTRRVPQSFHRYSASHRVIIMSRQVSTRDFRDRLILFFNRNVCRPVLSSLERIDRAENGNCDRGPPKRRDSANTSAGDDHHGRWYAVPRTRSPSCAATLCLVHWRTYVSILFHPVPQR